MACDVVWTDSARNDAERAVRYIAVNLGSPQAAGELLAALGEAVTEISLFHEAYAIREHPELKARGIRVKTAKRYLVLYSYDGQTATISRIFHSLQDYARTIGEQ